MDVKLKVLLSFVLFALVLAMPVWAQDNTVSFNQYSFAFSPSIASNVAISQFPGDPPTLEQPGGPEVKHTEFLFYNDAAAPSGFLSGAGSIRVYNVTDIATFENNNLELTALQNLLAERPDLTPFTVADATNNLPFLPITPTNQVLRTQVQYLDTPSLQGVRYVTLLRLDVSPFLGSEFLYTFQGTSTDGSTYVSAVFHLNTALFPAELPPDFDQTTFETQYADYLSQSAATLNTATPDQFTPSLTALDAVIQSFGIGGSAPTAVTETAAPPANATVPPVVTVPVMPTVQATATVEDTVMGGLAGITWTLISYGDPANPTPALGSPLVTLTFSGAGVSGNSGCNTFNGSFQFEGNTLTIGQLIRTLVACDQPIMAQEDAVLNALATASSFAINGNQLVINYDGGILNFTGA